MTRLKGNEIVCVVGQPRREILVMNIGLKKKEYFAQCKRKESSNMRMNGINS